MGQIQSIKDAGTVDDRRVLSLANTAVPNADPSSSGGLGGFNLQGADRLHIYAKFTGITGAAVTPWFYSNITGTWYEGAQITFSGAAGGLYEVIEVRGEDYVYFVADSVVGAGTLDLWAGISFDGRD